MNVVCCGIFEKRSDMVKRSFFNVGTICEKMMGVSKGVKSLGSGFPIGVSSIPIGTRFCLQSLMCYTFGDR